MDYTFKLLYQLPEKAPSKDALVERLGVHCNDATLGWGRRGHLALAFTREADSFMDAYLSAQADVLLVLPDAVRIDVD